MGQPDKPLVMSVAATNQPAPARRLWTPRLLATLALFVASRAFFGALNATSGQLHWADHDRQLAVPFVAFLTQLAT